MKTILTAAALTLTAAMAQADTAGLRIMNVALPHHDAEARLAIWYPAEAGGTPAIYAENPVFQGVEAVQDAGLAPGRHPVVLFSHGMGGTDRAQAWLGAALARRGAVTIMVNHPGSTWGDFDMARGVAHWTRAQDLRAALDAILAMPQIADSLDASRVTAAGFSYGGWTALSLGGARGNHAGIVATCERMPQMEACDLLLSDTVNMQGQDPALWNASYADHRVRQVVAIDPGFVWGLAAPDVSDLAPDTVLIGLGAPDTRMLATNFDASGLTEILGARRTERLAPAFHFSAMPLCTQAGPAILEAENDDPVCTDPPGTDRAALHAQIAEIIAQTLGL